MYLEVFNSAAVGWTARAASSVEAVVDIALFLFCGEILLVFVVVLQERLLLYYVSREWERAFIGGMFATYCDTAFGSQ